MSTKDDAKMTVTNVSSGLNLVVGGTASTVQSQTEILALTGFDLSTQKSDSGVDTELVILNNKVLESAPPTVVVQSDYVQSEGYDEVDMTLSYIDIPEGSSVEVTTSINSFEVSKRPISGTSNLGLMGNDLGPIETTFTISLWLPAQASLLETSMVSITLARIEGSSGGPQKRITMGKTMVLLAKTQ